MESRMPILVGECKDWICEIPKILERVDFRNEGETPDNADAQIDGYKRKSAF